MSSVGAGQLIEPGLYFSLSGAILSTLLGTKDVLVSQLCQQEEGRFRNSERQGSESGLSAPFPTGSTWLAG